MAAEAQMDEVVVKTGASGGIGRATARAFARPGVRIALLARGERGLAGAQAEVESAGALALAIPADVAHESQVTDSLRSELIHDRSNIHLTMVDPSAFNTPQFDWALNLVGRRPMPVPPIFDINPGARGRFDRDVRRTCMQWCVSRHRALAAGCAVMRAPADGVLRIHVVGKQWWWEVRYEQPRGREPIVLANEIRMPVNQPVELLLSSTDVIHSFWAPALAGKVDMIPGRTTRLRVHTSQEETFQAVCAEYCGGQHALMALAVVTQTSEEFSAWLARQALPVSDMKVGYDAFFKGDCHSCHTVRGTSANGAEGPDLTHVGGRNSLAAGILDNHIGTFAGWIAGTQDLKGGSKMPSTLVYTGTELRALSAWLESLE